MITRMIYFYINVNMYCREYLNSVRDLSKAWSFTYKIMFTEILEKAGKTYNLIMKSSVLPRLSVIGCCHINSLLQVGGKVIHLNWV